jgi:acylglycerol lipase
MTKQADAPTSDLTLGDCPTWRSGRWVVAALLAVMLAGGCETPNTPLDLDADEVAYYVSQDPTTTLEVRTYVAPDGQELAYLYHHRPSAKADKAVVYLHGIASHGGWFDEAADLLVTEGYDVFCLDRRGSGRNRENRGIKSGDIEQWETLRSDLDTFARPLRDDYDTVVLVGLSWGGKLALAYGLEHSEHLDGMVLITPGLRTRLPGEAPTAMAALLAAPEDYVKIPIEVEMFTKDPALLEKLKADPLRLQHVTARFLIEGVELDGHIDRTMPENELPILLVLAGKDQIIDNPAVTRIVGRGRQTILDIVTFSDQTHSVQFDAPRRLVRQIVGFHDEHIAPQTQEMSR